VIRFYLIELDILLSSVHCNFEVKYIKLLQLDCARQILQVSLSLRVQNLGIIQPQIFILNLLMLVNEKSGESLHMQELEVQIEVHKLVVPGLQLLTLRLSGIAHALKQFYE